MIIFDFHIFVKCIIRIIVNFLLINILEAVGKTGNLPPSERKILTKETHQWCFSFAIAGFSELFSSEKPHAACQKDFFDKLVIDAAPQMDV
jgi:hypothetical protein